MIKRRTAFEYMQFQNIDWSLYVILDREVIQRRSLQELAEAVIDGGAGVIQLRDKVSPSNAFYRNALAVKEVTREKEVPLLINDRVDIALAADADGVHLGQDDLPFKEARRIIGTDRILGASVHSLTEFEQAMTGKPDYLSVGTIYPSPTKQELQSQGVEIVKTVRSKTDLPLVAIGGLTLENLESVLQAGADGVVVVSDILKYDDVRARARKFAAVIQQAKTR